jgi:lysophospholipase L1-like esterase
MNDKTPFFAAIIRLISISALLSMTLMGCAEKSPPIAPLGQDAVILAFGDSLTRGVGAKPSQSYPALLQALSGRKVINAGKPGELSGEGAQRLPSLLQQHSPDLLILCHGGNDMLRKRAPAETEANLRRMIAAARELNIPVALIGVPKPGLFLSDADVYARLAQALDLPYQGEVLAEVLADRSLKSDTVHPNAAGYAQLAQAVYELLQDSGAL